MTLTTLTPADTLLISVPMESILYGGIYFTLHLVLLFYAVYFKGCSTILSAQAMALLLTRRKVNPEKVTLLAVVAVWLLGSLVSTTNPAHHFLSRFIAMNSI